MARPIVFVGQKRHIDATPEEVFAQLTDAWVFPTWVVGAAHIRGVDPDWPAPGSRLHHQVGGWPVSISDSTQVLECDAPHRLRLQARAWPVGEAEIDLRVEPDATGSTVIMLEGAHSGPGRWLDNPVQRWVLRRRNREALARLATIAENRRPRAPQPE